MWCADPVSPFFRIPCHYFCVKTLGLHNAITALSGGQSALCHKNARAREPLGDSHACFADTIYNECKISPEIEPTVLHIFGNKRGPARWLAEPTAARDDGGIQKLKKPITGAWLEFLLCARREDEKIFIRRGLSSLWDGAAHCPVAQTEFSMRLFRLLRSPRQYLYTHTRSHNIV